MLFLVGVTCLFCRFSLLVRHSVRRCPVLGPSECCFFCFLLCFVSLFFVFFFFNDTATAEIYTLSLRDALPISLGLIDKCRRRVHGQLKREIGRAHVNSSHVEQSRMPSSARKKKKKKAKKKTINERKDKSTKTHHERRHKNKKRDTVRTRATLELVSHRYRGLEGT